MHTHSKLPHTCAPARAEPDLSLFDAALWHANDKGQDGVVEILLAAGADATIRSKTTEPPLVVMQGVMGRDYNERGWARKLPGPGSEKIKRLKGTFTTERVRSGDHVLDNKTAFVVGVPDAAVGDPAFLKRHAPLLKKLYRASTDARKTQKLLLTCIEKLVGREAELMKKTPVMLKILYDADILDDEELIVAWHEKGSKKKVGRAVREAATPFVSWLKEADEESEEESDDEE